MSTVEHIRDGLVRALDSVAEGWHEVRDLAGDALTRFRPKSTRGEVESADDRLVNRAARWGLLRAKWPITTVLAILLPKSQRVRTQRITVNTQ